MYWSMLSSVFYSVCGCDQSEARIQIPPGYLGVTLPILRFSSSFFFFFRLSLDLMGNNATAMRRPFWKIAANSFKVVAIEPPPIRPFQPVTYCQEPSLETALTLTSLDYM